MNVRSIIDLSAVQSVKTASDVEKYFYVMILLTVFRESFDYCLRQHDREWHSIIRIEEATHPLPARPNMISSVF